MTRWHPRLELARLLQAISDDIIATTDEELRDIQGRALAGTARQVRRLVKAAQAAEGGGPRIVSSRDRTRPGVCSVASQSALIGWEKAWKSRGAGLSEGQLAGTGGRFGGQLAVYGEPRTGDAHCG